MAGSTNYKLLENLLHISTSDSCIYSKTGNFCSDFFSSFSQFNHTDLFDNEQVDISLEHDLESYLIAKLDTIKDETELKELLQSKGKKLTSNDINVFKDKGFVEGINHLKDKYSMENNFKPLFYKQLQKRSEEIYDNENVIPLHIATCFVKVKILDRVICAPLVLKEVEIEVGPKFIHFSNKETGWKLNEKLLFILRRNGYYIPNFNSDQENISFNLLFNYVKSLLKNQDINISDVLSAYPNLSKTKITNKDLELIPGVLLGLFMPGGGAIKKALEDIIDNNELEKIIPSEIGENGELAVIDTIKRGYSLAKIQKTNWIQDKATVAALNRNTVIWGPPGTGKTQTITNIITNILARNKKAVIMSQKKVAIDVLIKKMGKLSVFCIFLVSKADSDINKEEFYLPIDKLLEEVKNADLLSESPVSKLNNAVEKDLITVIDNISNLINSPNYQQKLHFFNHLYSKDILKKVIKSYIDTTTFNHLYNYPDSFTNNKEYINDFMKLNKVEKKGLLFKSYDKQKHEEIEKSLDTILDLFKNDLINMVNDIKNFSSVDIREDLSKIDFVSNYFLKDKKNILNPERYNAFCEKAIYDYSCSIIRNKIDAARQKDPSLYSSIEKMYAQVKQKRSNPQAFIRKNKEVLKYLFNIIATTPMTNFVEFKKDYYDYVILDESSQIHVENALPYLYAGKIKVIAGDLEQMRPSNWFSSRSEVDEDDLDASTEESSLSILEYCESKGLYKVMLDKNYRSQSSAIMSFSSKNFYKSSLEVIDNFNSDIKKPLEVFHVGGKREGSNKINKKEVEKVIEVLEKNIKKFKSILVVCFNLLHKYEVEKQLASGKYPLLDSALYEKKISVKNIENVQGDEAELVVMNVVMDPDTRISSTYVCRPGGKNALNVAVSRAIKKLVVVKSIKNQDIPNTKSNENTELFKEWIRFLDLDDQSKKTYSYKQKDEDFSEFFEEYDQNFEDQVIEEISKIKFSRPIKLDKKFFIGSNKIDLVLNDKETGDYIIGVQVDNHKYAGAFNKYKELKDINSFIEDKGYKIYTIEELLWKTKKSSMIYDFANIVENTIKHKYS